MRIWLLIGVASLLGATAQAIPAQPGPGGGLTVREARASSLTGVLTSSPKATAYMPSASTSPPADAAPPGQAPHHSPKTGMRSPSNLPTGTPTNPIAGSPHASRRSSRDPSAYARSTSDSKSPIPHTPPVSEAGTKPGCANTTSAPPSEAQRHRDGVSARCPYAWPKSWPSMPWCRMVERRAPSSTS